MTTCRITRRAALRRFTTAGLAAPFVFRHHATAAPSETLYHASFGANGMALSDIRSLTASRHVRLVAVAEVDLARAAEVRRLVPNARVYQACRQLLRRVRYLNGYYHPSQWRKRLDFGTGTFGDMGCHILDPVFTALALTSPRSLRSEGGAPGPDSWGLDAQVRYVFPGTRYTADTLELHWYD